MDIDEDMDEDMDEDISDRDVRIEVVKCHRIYPLF